MCGDITILTVRSVVVVVTVVLLLAGDAPVPGVGQGVVVLVHHRQPRAPLEVLCRQTVL